MSIENIEIKRAYYINEQLQYEMPYVNGLAHGIHLSWHENGTLASEHRYDNDLLNGLCMVYRRDGSAWYVFYTSADLQEGEELEFKIDFEWI